MPRVKVGAYEDYVFISRPLPKPRAASSGKAWFARRDSRTYMTFRDAIKSVLENVYMRRAQDRMPDFVPELDITITVYDWLWTADPDNVEGGILDALKPWPLGDDNWKWIRSLTIRRGEKPMKGTGFTVRVYQGRYLDGADSEEVGKPDRGASGRKEARARAKVPAKAQTRGSRR